MSALHSASDAKSSSRRTLASGSSRKTCSSTDERDKTIDQKAQKKTARRKKKKEQNQTDKRTNNNKVQENRHFLKTDKTHEAIKQTSKAKKQKTNTSSTNKRILPVNSNVPHVRQTDQIDHDLYQLHHTSDRSDRSRSISTTDPNLHLRDVEQDLYSTDLTQETCTRLCRSYGSHPAT